MDRAVNEGGVSHVSTHHSSVDGVHVVMSFIHHELTPERLKVLENVLETALFGAIKAFVKP